MSVLSSALSRDTARYGLAALTARRTRGAARSLGVILLHHDVAADGEDPHHSLIPALAVGVLREQIAHLRRRYHVVSLTELEARVAEPERAGRLPVALTFDDDLASHHRIVAPLLSEMGLPGTFFLTGASLDGPSSFWWHDLQQLHRAGGRHWAAVTDELASLWGEHRVPLSLGSAGKTIEAASATVRDPLRARLRALAADLPTDDGLDAAAVRDLVAGGFEVGFHTVAHHQLQTLTDPELRGAMRDGRERLETVTGHPLTRIAYPHGAADLRVASAAVTAGFTRGYTVRSEAVRPGQDPLLVPRVDAWTSASRLALQLAQLASDGV